MYTLYARNWAGSLAVEAMLAACGAPYKVVVLDRKPDGSFEDFFHALNPKAEVPTLVLPDDSVMTESAAMMIHLAEAFPAAGLAPAAGDPRRPQFLRWQVFFAAALYSSDLRLFYPQRYTKDAAEAPGIAARADETMMQEFAIYAQALGQGPFMFGRCGALDIYAAMLASWAPDPAALFRQFPNLGRMYAAVLENAAVKAVWERNGVTDFATG